VPSANSARGPLWTPDGKHVLYIDSVPGHSSEHDWWAARADSASLAPIRTRVRELLTTQQLPPLTASAFPLTWHRGRVVFTLKSRKEAQLWSVALSDGTLRAEGQAAQLFPGPGLTDARATGDDAATLVFARDEDANQLWAIPVSCGVRAGGAISSRTTNR
jgi:hypothetical protein